MTAVSDQGVQKHAPAAACSPAQSTFWPRGTVRCVGTPAFRTQLARDLACLLDLDDDVDAWSCLPAVGQGGDIPDFLVKKGDENAVVDAGSGSLSLKSAAEEIGYAYEAWPAERVRNGFRLRNARDLLRYAGWVCPLGDRIRLLAGLDEAGSLTVAECLAAFSETRPMPGLAALVLQRFVSVDLDTAPIGPETAVRRWRCE